MSVTKASQYSRSEALDSTFGGKIVNKCTCFKTTPDPWEMSMRVDLGLTYWSLREGAGQDIKVWEMWYLKLLSISILHISAWDIWSYEAAAETAQGKSRVKREESMEYVLLFQEARWCSEGKFGLSDGDLLACMECCYFCIWTQRRWYFDLCACL